MIKKFDNEVSRVDNLTIDKAAELLYVNVKYAPVRVIISKIISFYADKHRFKMSSSAKKIIEKEFPNAIDNDYVIWERMNGKSNKVGLHREHVVPTQFVYNYLVDHQDELNIEMIKDVLNKLECVMITNDERDLLDRKDKPLKGTLLSNMPENWNFTKNIFERFEAAGIIM